jgi:hypothetical protein
MLLLLLLLHLLHEQMQRAQEELQSNSYPEESVASLKLKCLLRKMQHLHALSRVFTELSHRAWLGSAHACLGVLYPVRPDIDKHNCSVRTLWRRGCCGVWQALAHR